MADNIQVLEEVLNSASRENRFRVNFTLPGGVSGDVRNLSILVRSTTLPGKNVGQIEVKHSGITHRIKGDEVTDATWNCEFLVPQKSSEIYAAMSQWLDVKENYKVQMTANQLDTQNNITHTFTMTGVWVQALPPINWSTESSDTIKSFDVTFSVDKIV